MCQRCASIGARLSGQPIKSATSERSFSALRRVITYLRSTMTEQWLNQCLLSHMHKHITDSLDLKSIAKEFIASSKELRVHF